MSSFWLVSILVLSLSVSDHHHIIIEQAQAGRQGLKTKQLAWCDALPSSDYSTHNDHNLVVCHINCSGRKSGEARPWSLFLIATEPLTLWKSWRTDFLPWVALFNYIIFLLLNYGTLPFPSPTFAFSVSEWGRRRQRLLLLHVTLLGHPVLCSGIIWTFGSGSVWWWATSFRAVTLIFGC